MMYKIELDAIPMSAIISYMEYFGISRAYAETFIWAMRLLEGVEITDEDKKLG